MLVNLIKIYFTPNFCSPLHRPLTCDTIFSSFLDGVLSDPVCALEDTAYDSFLQLVAPDLPVDTVRELGVMCQIKDI